MGDLVRAEGALDLDPVHGLRPGLRLPVADHAGGDQPGVVEDGAVGVRQRVAELAALVDRTGCLRGDVAGDPAGERELAEQRLQVGRVAGVAEQPRLDVLRPQRPGQQRVPHQVDLPDRQIVGCPPVGVDRLELGAGQRLLGDRGLVHALLSCVGT